MNTRGSDDALVRRVRTFADDLRRAQGTGAAPAAAPTTPAPVATPPIEEPPAPHEHPEAALDIRKEASATPDDGLIVRETLSKRWSLGRALKDSASQWLGAKKTELAQTFEEPTPTVAPTGARSHIVKQAREKSAIAPKDDRTAVVEKLRTFARDAELATGKHYSVLPAAEKPVSVTPSWTHTTDTPEAAPSRDIAFEAPAFTQPTAAPVRTYRADAIAHVEKQQLSVPKIAAAEATRRDRGTVVEAKRSLFPLLASAGAFTLLVLIGGSGVWWFTSRPSEPAPSQGTPAIIAADQRVQVPFSNDRRELLEGLATAVREADDSLVRITVTASGGSEVSTSAFLTAIRARVPASFTRNLNPELFIGASAQTPFLVLGTEQFDTAFAGMLQWEPSISTDLAPLFGERVRGTLVDETIVTPHFVDGVVANTDARLLRDEAGTTRLVYAFLDRETLIIAQNETALEALLEELR